MSLNVNIHLNVFWITVNVNTFFSLSNLIYVLEVKNNIHITIYFFYIYIDFRKL